MNICAKNHFFCQFLLIPISFLIFACGGSSGSGGYNEPPGSSQSSSSSSAAPEATLAHIQASIFSPVCAQCHTGAGAPLGLRLNTEQNSFDHLVDQPAGSDSAYLRVDPGNPDDSYLVLKLEGDPAIVGGQMPLGMAPLSSAQINLIRDWIANGAPRDGTGINATSLSLMSVQNTGTSVDFTLRFSRSIDVESVHDTGLLVYFINYEERWLAQPHDYRLLFDEQELTVSIAASDLPLTAVELVLNDPAASVIFDAQGRLIDGNNDGDEGGVYRHVYPF